MNTKIHFLTLCCLAIFADMAYAENMPDKAQSGEIEQTESEEQEENSEASVELEVKGIKERDKAAWDNVKIYLSQIASGEMNGSERHQYLVQTAVDKGLRAVGYYNTQYRFVQNERSGKKPLLTLYAELADSPVKVDDVDVYITGEAKDDEDFIKLIEAKPKKKSRLNHKEYDDFKSGIDTLAFKKGYFDGEWLYHRLEVYPDEKVADWRLGYSSGSRYRYGEISFTDSQIREDYLRNILKIQSGEYYYANDIAILTQDYSSSKWFTSVFVDPKVNEDEKIVDLNVIFQRKRRNEVEVGIGFETNVGPRFQFNWRKPWINNRGHSLETRTFLSSPEQSFEFGYNIPIKEKPLNYYYQISGSLEHEDVNDTKSTAATLGFQRFWTHDTGWSFSGGIKARYDSFTQGNDSYSTLLVYPTASLNRTRTDGKRYPLWADSQKLTVNWGLKTIASKVDFNSSRVSEVNFYSFKASTSFVRTYFDNHRFYLRGESGYLNAGNDFARIPPALRYFAGGDMSVRGFGYKNISPKDPNGKKRGGSHLLTGTFEYQYQVAQDWWGALFYDTGLASTNFSGKGLHSGVGVGVRWVSPVGAIKLDIATPVRSPDNQKGVKIYIGLGMDL